MRHRHHDMIVAKAANMDLVRLVKLSDNKGNEWFIQADVVQRSTQFSESSEYFLCLPQHKEACLHWLSGGEIQVKYGCDWVECSQYTGWSVGHLFMIDDYEVRIKPKKEKRFIAWNSREDQPERYSYCTLSLAQQAYKNQDVQIIEIEVEV